MSKHKAKAIAIALSVAYVLSVTLVWRFVFNEISKELDENYCHVTTINSDGPGSLKWCVESGRENIVLDISGTINLTNQLEVQRK